MGTEAFWIPVALAAASGGAQYANTTAANSRADKAEGQSLMDQQKIRDQGNAAVNKTVQQISKDNGADIAGKATGDYVAQLRRNSAGSATPNASSALAPVVGGSSRYDTSKGQSQQDVQSFGNTQASELGDLDSAVRERQNEGLDMQGLSTKLNTLGAQSMSQNFVDQLRAQTAGQASPWVSLFSSVLGAGAKASSMNPQWFGGANIPMSSLAPSTINPSTVLGGGNPYNA